MNKDAVDEILEQWSEERPELDTASLGVVVRVMALNKSLVREATSRTFWTDLVLQATAERA